MKKKTCTRCDTKKAVWAFDKKKTGKYGVRSKCKECRKEQRQEKRDFVDSFKQECKYCKDDRKYVLVFHHKDPNRKNFIMADATRYSWERIRAELKLCEVVCCNCHAEIHHEMNQEKEKKWELAK